MIEYNIGDVALILFNEQEKTSPDKLWIKIIGSQEDPYFIPFVIEDPVPVPVFLLEYFHTCWQYSYDTDYYAVTENIVRRNGIGLNKKLWEKVLEVWRSTSKGIEQCFPGAPI